MNQLKIQSNGARSPSTPESKQYRATPKDRSNTRCGSSAHTELSELNYYFFLQKAVLKFQTERYFTNLKFFFASMKNIATKNRNSRLLSVKQQGRQWNGGIHKLISLNEILH